jgi:peptidoglycan/LPS O-acetylase OafA/YrhL
MRGLAVLLVVAFHAGLPVQGGFTGVDVFFAISGFVITSVLLEEMTSIGRIDLRRFYVRRVKRLGPALAVMVTTIAVLGTVASPVTTQRVGAMTGLFASLFSANAYLITVPTGYFDPAATLNPFLHLWTLAVEEQFYLVFPALLLVGWWLGRRVSLGGRRTAVAAVSLTTALSFLLALHYARSGDATDQRLAFYGSPTRAWEFGAGALVALLLPWMERLRRPVAHVVGVLGLTAIGAAAFSIRDPAGFPVIATLLPVCGTCALLAAGTVLGERGVSRLLGMRPALWVGDLSFSWYLWHWPLIVFAGVLWPGAGWATPTLAALSLLPAWLSYRYVENPIRLSPRIAGRTALALAATCAAVPLAACLGFMAASNLLATTAPMQAYERSQVTHLDERAGCSSIPLGSQPEPRCTWGTSQRLVVLTGDSNASQFSEPVVRAATRAGFRVRIATTGDCPFIDLSVLREDRAREMKLCRSFYDHNLEAILQLRPSLVITAARTDGYLDSATMGLAYSGGPRSYRPGEKQRLWYQGLASTMGRLNHAGIPVVIVHPVPEFSYSVADCAVIRILTRSCESTIARGTADTQLQSSILTETRAAAALPDVFTLDPLKTLCGRDRCKAQRGGTLLYRDKSHLAVDGALTLENAFHQAIVAHAAPASSR